MKLCLVSQSFLPTIGGAEIAVHSLADELFQAGIETTVLTVSKNRLRGFNVDYEMQYFPHTPKGYLQGYVFGLWLYALQLRERYDVIHFHKAYMAYYALRIRRLLGAKIVITSHGGDIQTCEEIGYGRLLNPAWKRRVGYAVRNADLLTAIGSSTRRAYLSLGCSKNRIVDIANGANLPRFNDKCEDIRKTLSLAQDVKILLSVGRWHPAKGHAYLLAAVAILAKRRDDFKCVLVGKKLNGLLPTIREYGIEDNIVLVGEQSFDLDASNGGSPDLKKFPNDMLLSAYKTSDIYVSSSVIEAFPLTLVEAMAAGLPLVATNVAGNEDAVIDGINGYLVRPKDPVALAGVIACLLDSGDLRRRMSASSLEMSSQYRWSGIARQYQAAYASLLSDGFE